MRRNSMDKHLSLKRISPWKPFVKKPTSTTVGFSPHTTMLFKLSFLQQKLPPLDLSFIFPIGQVFLEVRWRKQEEH